MNNNTSNVVDSFLALKKRDWIKAEETEDTLFFPSYNDINVFCTSKDNRYPFILFSIPHELDLKYIKFNNYFYNISINRFTGYLELIIYDINNVIIYQKDIILICDLKYYLSKYYMRLALIYMENKMEENTYYYRYRYLNIYRYKGFDTFINLLNNNTIIVDINFKNIVFKINKKELTKLFKKEYSYDDSLHNFLSFLD